MLVTTEHNQGDQDCKFVSSLYDWQKVNGERYCGRIGLLEAGWGSGGKRCISSKSLEHRNK